jgi:hypothetical protein
MPKTLQSGSGPGGHRFKPGALPRQPKANLLTFYLAIVCNLWLSSETRCRQVAPDGSSWKALVKTRRLLNATASIAFISYAGEDRERFAKPFTARLRAKGIDAWASFREINPGHRLVDKIFEEGLKNWQVFGDGQS